LPQLWSPTSSWGLFGS